MLTWIGFNTIASRDALQINIEKFEDMLKITEKDISDLEYSYSKRTAADWQTCIWHAKYQAPQVDDTLGARFR